jgi:RNA polymerase primary sigma factor
MEAIKLYLKDIRSLPLLTPKREKDLARKVKKNDEKARQEMIKSNLRLVINIAKKYSYLGVPMLDLIEEGNLGLMKAVNKYDPEKGYRFSTYAAWWIKQYITRAVANQGKTVRIPVYVMEMLMRFQKVKKQLSQAKKRAPQINEISKKMKLPLTRIKQLNRMASNIASLNAPIGDSGGSEFMDLIEDETIVTAVDELNKFLLQERIEGLLDKMTERERKILTLRFGLDEGGSHTLRDTAKYFGITRERVRQIEAACMVKLRKMMEEQEKVAEDKLYNSKKEVTRSRKPKTMTIIRKNAKGEKTIEIVDRRKSIVKKRVSKQKRRYSDISKEDKKEKQKVTKPAKKKTIKKTLPAKKKATVAKKKAAPVKKKVVKKKTVAKKATKKKTMVKKKVAAKKTTTKRKK